MKDTEVTKEDKCLGFSLAQELFGSSALLIFLRDMNHTSHQKHHKKYSVLLLETTPFSSPKRSFPLLDVSLGLNTVINLLIVFLISRQNFLPKVSYQLIVLKTSHMICRNWQCQLERIQSCVSNKE